MGRFIRKGVSLSVNLREGEFRLDVSRKSFPVRV